MSLPEVRGYAINYGVKTGLNEAFIIDNETKDALVAEDPRSAEILKRVLRGKDIQRYQAEWAGMWLIDTHNGYGDVPPIEVDDYPAIKAFLDKHYERLVKRYDRGRTPHNLRNCAYHAEFQKEKLFWADMAPNGRFAFSDEESYCNNKGYIMTGASLKYLCAVLNSSLITWWVRNIAATTGMGLTEWTIVTVERLPIPALSSGDQRVLVEMVDRVLRVKEDDPSSDISKIDSAIDQRVYQLYGLTPREVSAVEDSISLDEPGGI